MVDDAESGLGAGSAAFVLGNENLLAEIEGYACLATEHLSSTFRNAGEPYITELGLTGHTQESVHSVLTDAITQLLTKVDREPGDYDYVVCSELGRAPRALLRMGFTWQQMEPCLLADRVGHTGACAPLLALVAALDFAEPGDKILVASYGYGSGSDVLSFAVTVERKHWAPKLAPELDDKEHVDYLAYLKIKRGLR
jgi:hydroxymethylglutaryl-CoA synthase